jgi:transcriptional regulator with XRE-family HTH domain
MQAGDVRVPQSRLAGLGDDRPETQRMMSAFGERLKSLRAAANLSQEKLAARCFLADGHISELERGVRAPSLTVLLMLARAMGVSVGALADGLPAPSREAGRAQTFALISRQPGIVLGALAESLALPSWYVTQLVRCLESFGEIVAVRIDWQPAWQPARGAVESAMAGSDFVVPSR